MFFISYITIIKYKYQPERDKRKKGELQFKIKPYKFK